MKLLFMRKQQKLNFAHDSALANGECRTEYVLILKVKISIDFFASRFLGKFLPDLRSKNALRMFAFTATATADIGPNSFESKSFRLELLFAKLLLKYI